MADFNIAVKKLLIKEGGATISNLANDKGGLTKYGISSRAYPDIDIKKLTETDAQNIYKRDYWQLLELDVEPIQESAEVIFECAVNSGVKTAKVLLELCKTELHDAAPFLIKFKLIQIVRYLHICNKNSSQRVFLRGWLNRILN